MRCESDESKEKFKNECGVHNIASILMMLFLCQARCVLTHK